MTQAILKKHFRQYLDVTSKAYLTEIAKRKDSLTSKTEMEQLDAIAAEHKQYIEGVKKDLTVGYCFGFALCHGGMEAIGRVNWWEDVLVKLNNWNGDERELDKPIIVRDALNGQRTTLRELFEKSINYVLFNHANVDTTFHDFMPAAMNQLNITKPGKDEFGKESSSFEITDTDGVIHTSRKNIKAAGHYTHLLLGELLTPGNVLNNICLVHANNHSLHISCHADGTWSVYDPNYSHHDVNGMHFTGTKDQAIEKIFEILKTQNLIVDVSCFDAEKKIDFSSYQRCLLNNPELILGKQGLSSIMRYTPELLPKIISLAKLEPDGNALKRAIAINLHVMHPLVKANGLYTMTHYAPNALIELLALADSSPAGVMFKFSLAACLADKAQPVNITPLHKMAELSPDSIQSLLKLVDRSDAGKSILLAICEGLTAINADDNATGLQMIAMHSPQSLPALFQLCDDTSEGKILHSAITKAATQIKQPDQLATIESILIAYPAALIDIINFADNSTDGRALRDLLNQNSITGNRIRNRINLILTTKTSAGISQLHLIARDKPELLVDVIKLSITRDANSTSLYRLLKDFSSTCDGLTGWQWVCRQCSPEEKAIIMKILLTKLATLNTPDLISFGKNFSAALLDDHSQYHGLCKERHSLFRNEYGKTTIWKDLMNKTKSLLSQRQDAVENPAAQEILHISTSRLFK